MKKSFISIFLCFVIIFSFPLSALAYSNDIPNNHGEQLPVLIVRGMDFTGLYLDEGTENETLALGDISAGVIIKTFFKAGLKYSLGKNADAAVDEIGSYVKSTLEYYSCDKQGKSSYNVSPHKYPGAIADFPEYGHGNANEWGMVKRASELYGGENVYYFVYDWRMNPLDIADEINDIVDLALIESGKEKVNIINTSMGGVMTMAYLTKYGHDKLNKCIFISSTFGGSDMITELFQGRLNIDAEALYNTIDFYLDNGFLSLIVKVLYKTGMLKALSNVANDYIQRYKAKAYDEFVTGCFGHMLSLWSLIKPESYEDCLDFMFGGKEDEYADFIAKTDALQEMMINRDNTLKEAEENGVEISIICAYNTPAIPLTETAFVYHTDGLLETHNMSIGASVSAYNETLNKNIINNNSSHISPDNIIDASTALFPNHTWFIKDSIHVGCSYGTEQSDFLFWLLDFKGRADVNTNISYPQFLISNKSEDLKPLS